MRKPASHAWIETQLKKELHPAQLKNLKSLQSGQAVAVITGQQPCLLGGASLTLHKILQTLSISDWLKSKGLKAVPMFWSASEDHDLHEMLKVELWNPDFTPQLYKLSGTQRGFAAETFAEPLSLHQSLAQQISPWLKDAFFSKPSHRFVDPFHHALQHCFGAEGLICVEPKDFSSSSLPFWDHLQQNAQALYQAYEENDQFLLNQGQALQAIRRRGLPIFALHQKTGQRRPLTYQNGLFHLEQNSDTNPLTLLNNDERLSPGALLRPIFAQAQLPILISVLGPAEYQYHRQTPLAFDVMQQTMPLCWPRLGGTYLPNELVDFFGLERQQLINYILDGQTTWIQDDPKLQRQIQNLQKQLDDLNAEICDVHPHQTGPLARFKRDLNKSLLRLQRGVTKANLTKQGWPSTKLQLCEDLLLPKGQAQERRLGWAQFLNSSKKVQQLRMVFKDPFDFSHRITT